MTTVKNVCHFDHFSLLSTLHLLTGKKLETVLTCPEFERIEYISKMDIENGVLLVACGDEGIKMFKVS